MHDISDARYHAMHAATRTARVRREAVTAFVRRRLETNAAAEALAALALR